MKACDLSTKEISEKLNSLRASYEAYRTKGLNLNVSRGLPSAEQLELNQEMFHILDNSDCISEEGADIRNYGVHFTQGNLIVFFYIIKQHFK